MGKTNRLFYTVKLTSSLLKEYKYNLSEITDKYENNELIKRPITFEDCLRSGLVISLSDSQMLKSIRDITRKKVDRDKLEEWYTERDRLKKSKNNSQKKRNRIKELQRQIYDMMYIPEYVTVVMENEKDYERMFKKGFIFMGKKYRRISCSASQARVSTIVFVTEDIKDELKRRLDNGRDLEHKLAPSKYNAYFGLYSSSIKQVRKPRFCVVPDYTENDTIEVDYVVETDEESDDIIEPRTMEIEFNRFDGSGIISPDFAKKWGEDLGEDYTPCQFCLRTSFTKGMVNVFDFKLWCKEKNNENYIIKDIYGNERDLREIDIILSESQVKMWDSWESQEAFERNCEDNGIIWGVTKYAPKQDKDVLITNYQFLQTLDLDDNSIKRLCKDTIEYIQGVSYDDKNYALLFMLGENMELPDINNFLLSSDNYFLKSLILESNLFNDKYTREKIRDLIIRKIELACLGKILVRGNFQCIVPDNYSYMQHITGQKVTGLLQRGQFYSSYWNNLGVKKIDCMRSPLTHFSEHYVVDLVQNEETEKWYQYSYSGIITNTHDEHTMHFAGSDYDYDILATTNNEEFINGVYPNQRVVTYDVKKPKKKLFTEDDLFRTDTFSFGNQIGQITNTISSTVSLIPLFPKDSEERKILVDRVKAGCAAQSRQIDKTKIGENVKTLGSCLKKWQHINEEDSPEEIEHKQLLNRILADKKPYFFRYKYKTLSKEYNEYVKRADENAQIRFSKSFEEVANSTNKTPEEEKFLMYYDKYLPVINSDCVMNKICKYIESVDFQIKQKIKTTSEFDPGVLLSQNFLINKKIYAEIKEIVEKTFKEWEALTKARKMKQIEQSLSLFSGQEKFDRDIECALLKQKLEEVTNSDEQLANHLVYLFYIDKPSYSKATLWRLVGKQLYENIKSKHSSFIFPVRDDNGDLTFLYKKYQRVSLPIPEPVVKTKVKKIYSEAEILQILEEEGWYEL